MLNSVRLKPKELTAPAKHSDLVLDRTRTAELQLVPVLMILEQKYPFL